MKNLKIQVGLGKRYIISENFSNASNIKLKKVTMIKAIKNIIKWCVLLK